MRTQQQQQQQQQQHWFWLSAVNAKKGLGTITKIRLRMSSGARLAGEPLAKKQERNPIFVSIQKHVEPPLQMGNSFGRKSTTVVFGIDPSAKVKKKTELLQLPSISNASRILLVKRPCAAKWRFFFVADIDRFDSICSMETPPEFQRYAETSSFTDILDQNRWDLPFK